METKHTQVELAITMVQDVLMHIIQVVVLFIARGRLVPIVSLLFTFHGKSKQKNRRVIEKGTLFFGAGDGLLTSMSLIVAALFPHQRELVVVKFA